MIMVRLCLLLSVLGPSCSAAEGCELNLRTFGEFPWQRSRDSIEFWQSAQRRPAPSFEELRRLSNLPWSEDLPPYEARPTQIGMTDWVMAFARAYPLEPSRIAQAEKLLQKSRENFRNSLARLRDHFAEESQRESLDLAFRSQYYAEMVAALRGDFLPFPSQGLESIDSFLIRRSGGGYLDLLEAHTRLHDTETQLIELTRSTTKERERIKALMMDVEFYQRLIAELAKHFIANKSDRGQ